MNIRSAITFLLGEEGVSVRYWGVSIRNLGRGRFSVYSSTTMGVDVFREEFDDKEKAVDFFLDRLTRDL